MSEMPNSGHPRERLRDRFVLLPKSLNITPAAFQNGLECFSLHPGHALCVIKELFFPSLQFNFRLAENSLYRVLVGIGNKI